MTDSRIGHGYDIHRLQPGGRLLVGGVVVSETMSAVAHSDGDVAIHALVDAIFGALGVGDIGEHFSDTDPQWKNASSDLFLTAAVAEAKAAGYAIANADVTLMAEKPKIKPFKAAIRDRLTTLCHAPVNLKAGTNEGCDAVGRGEAIAAHAVVLLTRQT
ncbi:MAG TPA: 2-C-methyl-D-erythritol 2,4-cyclodiphosphate synthase [Tepidisphaeraceae bacterium]|jgi:2-C-methyl-D-erythritol 2,4-cyclodiphosphate synthase